jgi:hypothetical protein
MSGWWANTDFRAGMAASGMVTVGVAAFVAVISAVTGTSISWALIVLLPLGLLVLLTAIFAAAIQPWRHAADIKAMLAGNAWVHWTYDEAAWKAANRYDERAYKRWVRGTLIALAVSLFLLLFGILGGKAAVDVTIFGGIGIFVASVGLVALLVGNPMRTAGRAKRGEVYVSRHGIYRRPGGYTPLDLRSSVRYESVDLVDRPTPHIHIEISVLIRYSWRRKTLTDLGVPPGHQDEARVLVTQLRNKVVTRA